MGGGDLDVISEGELVERLLTNYQKHGRPLRDANKPVVVTLGATLHQIQKVDAKEGTLTTMVWLNLAWKDEFLVWNSSQAQGIEDIRMDIEDIWIPDIEVYNVVARKGLREREQVVVSSTGEILWVPPYILTTTCKLDFHWFPYDQQTCPIKFGSWTYNGWKLDIQLQDEQGMDISSFVVNEEWDLVRAEGGRNEVLYECCPEPYLDITYTVTLNRKPAMYLQRYIVPSALLTCLGILTLLLPASQPSSRLLILLFTFLMITLASTSVPQASRLAALLASCTFTLLLLMVHTILIVSFANSRSFYLACSPLWRQRLLRNKDHNEEEDFKVQVQRISWWVDLAAFWIYLICFGGYFSYSVAEFPVLQ